jgi:hypothetical protein
MILQDGFKLERLQRWGHSMVQHGKRLLAFGGYGGTSTHRRLNDLITIETSTGSVYEPTVTGTEINWRERERERYIKLVCSCRDFYSSDSPGEYLATSMPRDAVAHG